MKVLSMALTHIKRYRGTTVFDSLAPGVLLLLGRNGCGKSTLPQAVGLSVFGAIPSEFKNSSGKGLVGFVNRQESAGAIRTVVEIRPGRILTFDTRLKVLPLKGDQLDPSNEVRTSVYVGVQPLEGDLPKASALHQSLPIAGIAALIQEELGTRERGDALYGTLLSPSQSGGLTAYLSETPKKRQDQTERILGLQTVKKVGEVLRELCKERRAAAGVHQDQLRDALTAAAERYEALAPLLEAHGATTVPFEALTEGELRAAGTTARSPLVQTVATRAGEVIEAQRALQKATALAASLRALSEAARRLVEQLVGRDTAQKEVTDGEAAVKEAAALADDAARWQKAHEQVEALTATQRERDKGIADLGRAVGEAQKDLKHLAAQATARAAERGRLAKEEADEKAGLDVLLTAFADWADREQKSARAIEAIDTAGRDLAVLRELLAACADLGDLDAPQDKLGRLQEALGQGRLPDDAKGLVDAIADQLASVSTSETPTSASAHDQLDGWEVANATALRAARVVQQNLIREKADVETARLAFDKANERRAKRRETLDGEDAKGKETRQATEAAIAQHEAAREALKKTHAGLDEALDKARSTRDDPTLEERRQAWVIATSRAASLPAHKEALEKAEATVQTALGVFTQLAQDDALPVDTEGWRQRRDDIEGRERAAQDARVTATGALGETRGALQDAQEEVDALAATMATLCRQRLTLERHRASHRELQTLHDAVVSPLPRCVASRVVERVSSLANDFFQELFVQPSEPASVSWQTSDYEVRLTRGGESIPAKHASGGEKMAIGISLNLALIHYMAPEVRWLVLDEPTASLDKENRAGLRDVVERLREPMDDGQRLFDQLLFISHESALFEGLGASLDFAGDGDD